MAKEHNIQNEIRNEMAGQMLLFRANVGRGWTGSRVSRVSKDTLISAKRGSVYIENARPFDTGLPPGFSDLFGGVSVKVTPAMVGKEILVFTALEVKTEENDTSNRQDKFLQAIKTAGGVSFTVRSSDAARAIIARVKRGLGFGN